MSLQTRLSALISAVGADVKALGNRLSTVENTKVLIIDGGATPTETNNGSPAIGGTPDVIDGGSAVT